MQFRGTPSFSSQTVAARGVEEDLLFYTPWLQRWLQWLGRHWCISACDADLHKLLVTVSTVLVAAHRAFRCRWLVTSVRRRILLALILPHISNVWEQYWKHTMDSLMRQ